MWPKTLNDRLAIVLFQLPPWFRKDVTVLKKFLGPMPRGLKVTFEFSTRIMVRRRSLRHFAIKERSVMHCRQ
jgi:uncharacterized protein YecE (DUF72 family)